MKPLGPAPRRCLFVDDDQDFLDSIQQFLEESLINVTVDTETDPERALGRIIFEPPRIVFADLRLEGMDGLEFLRRAHKIAPRAKTVLVTGYAGQLAPRLTLLSQEVDLVLLKPLQTKPFLASVQRLLDSNNGPDR